MNPRFSDNTAWHYLMNGAGANRASFVDAVIELILAAVSAADVVRLPSQTTLRGDERASVSLRCFCLITHNDRLYLVVHLS